jgi:uncharacterized phage protein (TIGR02218 family)
MNYLGRPVFDVVPNWRTLPTKAFSYDLRDFQIGFGRKKAAPTQNHVIQGFEMLIDLQSSEEIAAFTAFWDGVKGRLQGFWLPGIFAAVKIVDGHNATQFDIEKQDLVSTFAEHPDRYLYFTKDGETALIAKITGVAVVGDIERVTVDAPITVDETWTATRLFYVRLASDTDDAELRAEGVESRTLRIIELPTEYAAFELGISRIYLYEFRLATPTPIVWRYTSFDDDVLSNGNPFLSGSITHGSLRKSAKGGREEVTIEAFYEFGHPLSLFVPVPLAKQMEVTIYETTLGDPDTTTVLFSGFVIKAPFENDTQKAQCSSALDFLGSKILAHTYGPVCPYGVGEPGTCKVDMEAFRVAVTISQISGNVLELTGDDLADKLEDWFSLGWIETGDAGTFEIRSILKSTADAGDDTILVILDAPLALAAVNQAADIFPGCDGLKPTCRGKFGNFVNWGGNNAPDENPTVHGFDDGSQTPNKKS